MESPGEESLTAAVAAQVIEAQPSFGQIKPKRDRVVRAPNSIPEQETWPTSFMEHKEPGIPGEGKEALAYKKAARPRLRDPSGQRQRRPPDQWKFSPDLKGAPVAASAEPALFPVRLDDPSVNSPVSDPSTTRPEPHPALVAPAGGRD